MKFFIGLTLLTASLFAHAVSINPARTVTPLIDIFAKQNRKLNEKTMEVRVSTYHKKTGEVSKDKQTFKMPMQDYDRAISLSKAVFRMVPTAESVKNRGDVTAFIGTAFHIGENLVLTNHHVLSKDRDNSTECGGFQLLSHDSMIEPYPCKKVHYCDVKHDVCLIEMGPTKKCFNSFCTKKEIVEMKSLPSLKLKENPQYEAETFNTAVMSCIGNTKGLGIHFSQGSGVIVFPDKIYFFAPLRSGNSGGPLIGEDNLVWGVVRMEHGAKVGDDSYNSAAASDLVISLMQEHVQDSEILEKFNKAIQH